MIMLSVSVCHDSYKKNGTGWMALQTKRHFLTPKRGSWKSKTTVSQGIVGVRSRPLHTTFTHKRTQTPSVSLSPLLFSKISFY